MAEEETPMKLGRSGIARMSEPWKLKDWQIQQIQESITPKDRDADTCSDSEKEHPCGRALADAAASHAREETFKWTYHELFDEENRMPETIVVWAKLEQQRIGYKSSLVELLERVARLGAALKAGRKP